MSSDQYDRVLVPTDGSDAAESAISHAIAVAQAHDAEIHGVFVVDSRITMAAENHAREELADHLRDEGEAAVDRIVDGAAEAGISATASILRGTPWKAISRYAADEHIDIIVIATTGKTPREKRIGMGSVSERVVADATVPVMVVPPTSPDGS